MIVEHKTITTKFGKANLTFEFEKETKEPWDDIWTGMCIETSTATAHVSFKQVRLTVFVLTKLHIEDMIKSGKFKNLSELLDQLGRMSREERLKEHLKLDEVIEEVNELLEKEKQE